MKMEYKTVLKYSIALLLIIVIVTSIYNPSIEKSPDNNSSDEEDEKTTFDEKSFSIFYRESLRGRIVRYTFDGSYEFTDFDSSSIDINDQNTLNESNGHNNIKKYDSKDFEESTATNEFFIPSHTKDTEDLSEKIYQFRDQLHDNYMLRHICTIEINRNILIADSIKKILCLPKRFLQVNLQVQFKDELGIDAGGLKKEWFNLIIKKAIDPKLGYFCSSYEDATTLRLSVDGKNKNEYKCFYRFIGRLIGMAILQDCQITTNFDKNVYKYLLNKDFRFSDLEVVDPFLYKGYKYYIENDIEKDDFSFTYLYKKNNKDEQKDLIRNGSNIKVTNINKKSYLKLTTEMILYRLIRDQLNAMKKGLYDIIEPYLLFNFSESDFELLLCGVEDIDVDDWKNNTIYENYGPRSQIIRWFWTVVEEFSQNDKRKLLHFATGSDKVPYGGFANLKANGNYSKFKIQIIISDSTHLPIAHTCFNTIDLPQYTSKDNLKEKLLQAITECSEGFGDY